jgi:7-carboxy-7-deazaguanine synthase
VEECIARAKETACPLVEITGGEPLLQDSVYALMTSLCDHGYEVLLETSGAVGIEGVDPRVGRIVDWKCPGSGMVSHNQPSVIENLRLGDELKLVLADRSDYEWARRWLEDNRPRNLEAIPVHFCPVFGKLSPQDLADWILQDRLSVRIGLQLHKSIWNPDARGV